MKTRRDPRDTKQHARRQGTTVYFRPVSTTVAAARLGKMFNLDGCNFTDTTVRATTVIFFATYYVFLPYCNTFGLLLNLLLIAALIRRTKSKITYGYQLLLTCSKTFQNVTFGVYVMFAYWWGGMGGYAAPWFVRNYVLVYVVNRILPSVFNAGLFLSLFLSVAISGDRVFSLAKPLLYKAINHRVHQATVIIVSVLLSVGMNVDKYWLYLIVPTSTDDKSASLSYRVQTNPDYLNAAWGDASESIRTYVRTLCLLSLLVLNLSMIHLHRQRVKRLESMSMTPSHERILARRETNKDLTRLALCQSMLMYIEHVPNMVGTLMRQVSAYWLECSFVMLAEVHFGQMLAIAAEVFLLLAVNRRLRRTVPGYATLAKICPRLFHQQTVATS